jgi:hypothetical protein
MTRADLRYDRGVILFQEETNIAIITYCLAHFCSNMEKLFQSTLARDCGGNRPSENPMLTRNQAQIL